MPPCPPQDTAALLDEGDKFTSNGKVKSEPKPPPLKPKRHTFAWELNALSLAFAGALFSAIPADYRKYFYFCCAIIVLDIARYYRAKGTMAGVTYTLPVVGLVSMIVSPVRYWREQGEIACESPSGLSTNSLGGAFMVFVTDPKLCREVMTNEKEYGLFAHPNALWLFGANNLIYMKEAVHKKFRAILTPALFSNEALTMYAERQERVCRDFMAQVANECASTKKPVDARIAFRSMAAAASQESFVGPYLTDELRKSLEEDILLFTLGFLCFPFPYLGTGLAKAIQAKKRIQKNIMTMVPAARERAAAGKEPRCLLDHWMVPILEAAKEQGCAPTEVNGCSDVDVATAVMDFLFAAQDATNSALTFSLDVLATRPDVVEKVREEVETTCKGKDEIWSLLRDPDKLEYTWKVANQMLHHKPPVPMVPHLAEVETTLAGHRIPKGTVVIPSIAYSARMSGASVDFDPEREDQDSQFVKTVTFGAGQHKCPGRRYAESLLTVFLAILCENYEWERVGPRPDVDDIMYYPTLFPSKNEFIITPREDEI